MKRDLIAVIIAIILIVSAASCKKAEVAEKVLTDKKEVGIVTLSAEKLQAAGIETLEIKPEPLAALISSTAVVEFNGDKLSKVSPRVPGRIVKLAASQGDRVMAGQPLAYLDSMELDQAWSDYVKAKGKTEVAKKNLNREETLFEKKISPEKDVIKTRQEMREAEADLNLAVEKFHMLGVDIRSMEQLKNGKHPLIPVSSSVNGTVVERTATLGEITAPDKTLFTVADLSALWVVIDIYENSLPMIHQGTSVKVSVSPSLGENFRGVIAHVGDVVDEKSRTVKARVVIENRNGKLKPGMFATVTIDAKSQLNEQIIAVPEDAFLLEGSNRYLFVVTGPNAFTRREVTVGRSLGNKLEVIEGLNKGDLLVVKGAFMLKSEMKKESLAGE